MSTTELESLMTQAAREASGTIFEMYGVHLEPIPAAQANPRDVMATSLVGFVGRRFRGSLVLAVSEGPLVCSNPEGTASEDWLGELCNQVLGRVKRTLLCEGIEFRAVPPATTTMLIPGKGCGRVPITLTDDQNGIVYAWIEVKGTCEQTKLTEAEPLAEAGEVILF